MGSLTAIKRPRHLGHWLTSAELSVIVDNGLIPQREADAVVCAAPGGWEQCETARNKRFSDLLSHFLCSRALEVVSSHAVERRRLVSASMCSSFHWKTRTLIRGFLPIHSLLLSDSFVSLRSIH